MLANQLAKFMKIINTYIPFLDSKNVYGATFKNIPIYNNFEYNLNNSIL